MMIFAWIIGVIGILGIVSFIVGLSGFLVYHWLQQVHKLEVRAMKKDGKLEGEDEFMRTFRVGRAKGELTDNLRKITFFRRLMINSIIAMVIAAIFLFFF